MDLLYSQSKRTKWKLQVVCCLSGSSVRCKSSAPKLPPKKGCHNLLKGIINIYGNSYPEEVFYFRAEEFIVSQFEAPSDGTDFESIKFNVRNKATMLVLANPPRTNSKEKHPKNLLLIPSAILWLVLSRLIAVKKMIQTCHCQCGYSGWLLWRSMEKPIMFCLHHQSSTMGGAKLDWVS